MTPAKAGTVPTLGKSKFVVPQPSTGIVTTTTGRTESASANCMIIGRRPITGASELEGTPILKPQVTAIGVIRFP
jgi:hypothetical protein